MLRITMLSAGEGDALWIEYGDEDAPRRVLIDGGRGHTAPKVRERLLALPEDARRLELLVITHVDRDHIEGVLELLADGVPGLEIGDVWFNGYRHLRPDTGLEELGPVQGEKLTWLLTDPEAPGPWNQAFGGGSVVIGEDGELPAVELPGGLKLTLLSPDWGKLAELEPVWEREVRKAGLVPGAPPEPEPLHPSLEPLGAVTLQELADEATGTDHSEANGSSIAVLAELDGKRALLAGDAHPDRLVASIDALAGEDGRLEIDAFKLPHHGSKNNTTRELIQRVACPMFLVSTTGAYFGHPDDQAMARVIVDGEGPVLCFNARSEHNEAWETGWREDGLPFHTLYPEDGADGLTITLSE